jgi:hypothetical protein
MKANAIKSILALAVAAVMLVVAPAGLGANGGGYLAPDDRPGLHGPGGIDTGSEVGTADYLAPDDRPGLHGPGSIDTARGDEAVDYLAPDDRPGLHGPRAIDATAGEFDVAPRPTYVEVAVDGFDWGSAGIGAGAGAGAILAVIGAVLFLRSSRLRTEVT